ncbi:hypothetical protein AC579_8628 [Pseudocercospora musae]|uniref:WD40 repeat-like protein n=1 Tax=Pseudocercospora musae TaxID=113226 RepID=A0A139IFY1_9PEZI|nr:hypothetical protein AC579_8628 [Pseudocercospora musae]
MPITRKDAPLPSIPQHQTFTFPQDRHLLITTPRNIFAWDSGGIHEIFHSSKGGIVAAKEAKDGSGMLAVASRNVVVMHDTKRGKEESWGLSAPEEEVRHLEYSNDAKSLFLSNTSDGVIQQYSVERSRLLAPAQQHSSSPAAVAISPTGHLLLSGSSSPPEISLKNLVHNSSPTLVMPEASSASVCCAAFHPERPNVFMLAFRDGTVSAYDATRIKKHYNSSGEDGEISHIPNLHRSVVFGTASVGRSGIAAPVIAVAFLPGFKTRAVSVGHDGRCRLFDFANGGVVLRTWHAKAPLTCLSVSAGKPSRTKSTSSSLEQQKERSRKVASHTIGGPTSIDSIIAVGRVDGKVYLYDTLGLLLAQKSVSSQEDAILSLEWARGPSPMSIKDSIGHFSDDSPPSLEPNAMQTKAMQRQTQVTSPNLPEPQPPGLGLPPDLRPLKVSVGRQFTFHPDEVDAGTVRRKPASPGYEPPTPPVQNQYNDLFSPVKVTGIATRAPARAHISSPQRARPRISSTTFTKQVPEHNGADPRKLSILTSDSHATSSSSAPRSGRCQNVSSLRPVRRISSQLSPLSTKKRHITFKGENNNTGGDATFSRQTTGARSRNAREEQDYLLATRKISADPKPGSISHTSSHQKTFPATSNSLTNTVQKHGDQFRGGMPPVSEPEDDIWFTSESEEDERPRRSRRPLIRPPARLASRSQINSKGTISTTAENHQPAFVVNPPPEKLTDKEDREVVTAEETCSDQMVSAKEQLSPQPLFSPGSENVRQLFPRSSSLSPRHKKKQQSPAKPRRRKQALNLTAIALNAEIAARQQPKSPWARVRAGKSGTTGARASGSPHQQHARPVRKNEFVTVLDGSAEAEAFELPCSSQDCSVCGDTRGRVKDLESEVAHLKGEVVALKAVLRQNGLPFPACLR